MTKCNGKIKLNLTVAKCAACTDKDGYLVIKSIYDCKTGNAIEIPHTVKEGLSFKEAHALKRQIIADYFG